VSGVMRAEVQRAIKLAVDLWPVICEVEEIFSFPISAERFVDELNKRGIRGRWDLKRAEMVLHWSRYGERLGFLDRDDMIERQCDTNAT
jgi:hypothetical protein